MPPMRSASAIRGNWREMAQNAGNMRNPLLEKDLLASHIDIEDKTYGDKVCHERAAAVAQEGKGNTCHRHQAHCHTDVNQNMDKNH